MRFSGDLLGIARENRPSNPCVFSSLREAKVEDAEEERDGVGYHSYFQVP